MFAQRKHLFLVLLAASLVCGASATAMAQCADLRRPDGGLSAGGRSGVYARDDNDLCQRVVSGLLARSRQSRCLGRSRYYDDRWLRAHGNLCSLSAGDGWLRAGQFLSDMFDLLNLFRELRADVFDVRSELRSRLLNLLRKLRADLLNLFGELCSDLLHLHCQLCSDVLDLWYGERSRDAAGV